MIFKTTISNLYFSLMNKGKSRRDGILITVDFNLRTRNAVYSPCRPAGTTWRDKVSSLWDFGGRLFSLL